MTGTPTSISAAIEPRRVEPARFLSGTAILSVTHLVAQGSSFARNVLLTRLLGVEDFGVACAFAAVIGGLETMSNLSVDRLVVQSRADDQRRFLGTLHGILLVRAIILAAIIAILGGFIAQLLGVPEATGAFRALAIVPLIRGFMNTAVIHQHRAMRFTRSAIVDLAPQLFALALAWPAVQVFGSYWAVWWLIVLRSMMSVTLSHMLTRSRWRPRWYRSDIAQIVRFSWPLLINGLLMALVLHVDKLIVGGTCGVAMLAAYSIAALVTTLPAHLLTRIIGTVMFPVLSEAQDDSVSYRVRARLSLLCHGGMSIIMVVVFALLIAPMMGHIFGEAYLPAAVIVPWFAAAEAVRIFRIGVVQVALARGDSLTALRSNLVRAPAVLIQLPVAIMTGSPESILLVALAAEVAASAIALSALVRTHFCLRGEIAPLGLLVLFACVLTLETTCLAMPTADIALRTGAAAIRTHHIRRSLLDHHPGR